MAHRSFSAARDEVLKERPSFDLLGESFTCKPTMSIAALDAGLTAIQESTGAVAISQAALGFFDKALIKADRQRFRDLVDPPEEQEEDDDEVSASINDVTDILKWLVETYSGNPSGPSSDSGSGQQTPGPSSKEASSEVVDVSGI